MQEKQLEFVILQNNAHFLLKTNETYIFGFNYTFVIYQGIKRTEFIISVCSIGMQNIGQPFTIAKSCHQKHANSSTIVPNTQKNHFQQKQPPKNRTSPTFYDSLNHLQIKISWIQNVLGKKSFDTIKAPVKKIKVPKQDYSNLRKTTSFSQAQTQTSSSFKLNRSINNSQDLLLKADELIKRSTNLSQRILLKKNQYLYVPNKNQKYISEKPGQNTSSLHKSYSFSSSFKKSPIKQQASAIPINPPPVEVLIAQKKYKNEPQLLNLKPVQTTEQINLIKEDFQFLKLLGKGKFGQVHLGMHKMTGFLVAIKRVSKANLVKFNMVSRFAEEIYLHSKLDHPNIVKFYGFYQQEQYICLVLQYLSGGTLFDFQNNKGTFSIKQATGFLREVIGALTYLHEKRIAHRDLKPQNIVLSSTGIAKLCDFGWSTVVQQMRTTFCGTLDYASPEVLQKKEYDWSVDVWCVGILTYELLIGHAPFQNNDRRQEMQDIINVDKTGLPYLESLPWQAQNFITALAQKDPKSRPKISQLLDFPLFSIDKNRKKPNT